MEGFKAQEIKLRLEDPQSLSGLMQELEEGEGTEIRLETLYYDTSDLDLHRAGYAYLVNLLPDEVQGEINPRGTFQGGISAMEDWTRLQKDERPDLDAFQDLPVWAVLKEAVGEKELELLFAVRYRRMAATRFWQDGSRIDYYLDRGTVAGRGLSESLLEVKLILREGRKEALLEAAEELQGRYPLALETRTKDDRGLALLGIRL